MAFDNQGRHLLHAATETPVGASLSLVMEPSAASATDECLPLQVSSAPLSFKQNGSQPSLFKSRLFTTQ